MPGRIYRRCQECGAVARASAFKRVRAASAVSDPIADRLRCPSCGHVGPRVGFPRVDGPDPGET